MKTIDGPDPLRAWDERHRLDAGGGWSLKHQKRIQRALRNGGNPNPIMKKHKNRGAK